MKRALAWAMLVGCGRLAFDPEPDRGDAGATPTCATCEVGLIAHWKLDEVSGTTVTDAVGGHDGQLIEPAAWAGGVLELTGGYVVVPWSGMPAAPAFTAALWVRTRATTTAFSRYIANYAYDLAHSPQPDLGAFSLNSGVDRSGMEAHAYLGGTWAYVAWPGTFPIDEWHHVATWYDGVAYDLVLDGVHVASVPASGPMTASDPVDLGIGISIRPDGSPQNELDGTLDDVRIYDRALTAAELAALATR